VGVLSWWLTARAAQVKGPTDTLSYQQRAWLCVLHDAGLDACVCKVGPTCGGGAR